MTRILTLVGLVVLFVSTAVAQVPEGAQLAACQSPAVTSTTKVPVQHVPKLRTLTGDEEKAIQIYLDAHPDLGSERQVTDNAIRFLTALGQSHFPLTRKPYEYAVDYQIFTQGLGQVDWYVNLPGARDWPEFTPVGPAPPIVPLGLTPLGCPGPDLVPVVVGDTPPALTVHARASLELKDARRPCINMLVTVADRLLTKTSIYGEDKPLDMPALPEVCEAPVPLCQPVAMTQQTGVRPLGASNEANPEISRSNLDLLIYWQIARGSRQSQSQSQSQTCTPTSPTCPPGVAPPPPPVGNTTAPTTPPPLGNGDGWGGSHQPPAQKTPQGVEGHSWEPKPPSAE